MLQTYKPAKRLYSWILSLPAPKGCIARPVISISTLAAGRSRRHNPRPWRPRTLGMGHYLASSDSEGILRSRIAADMPLQTLAYGESIEHHGVKLSFHPAGHVLGSAGAHGIQGRSLGRFGRLQRSSRTAPVRRSSRCAAIPSSPNRPSACRSTSGRRKPRSSARSTIGGAPTPRPGAPACCSAMPSARRSASSTAG